MGFWVSKVWWELNKQLNRMIYQSTGKIAVHYHITSRDHQEYYRVRKTPFWDAVNGFPVKRRLWNECRSPILITYTSQIKIVLLIGHAAKEIFFSQSEAVHAQICVMKYHQYAISALVPQTSFYGKTSGGVAQNVCCVLDQVRIKKQTYL